MSLGITLATNGLAYQRCAEPTLVTLFNTFFTDKIYYFVIMTDHRTRLDLKHYCSVAGVNYDCVVEMARKTANIPSISGRLKVNTAGRKKALDLELKNGFLWRVWSELIDENDKMSSSKLFLYGRLRKVVRACFVFNKTLPKFICRFKRLLDEMVFLKQSGWSDELKEGIYSRCASYCLNQPFLKPICRLSNVEQMANASATMVENEQDHEEECEENPEEEFEEEHEVIPEKIELTEAERAISMIREKRKLKMKVKCLRKRVRQSETNITKGKKRRKEMELDIYREPLESFVQRRKYSETKKELQKEFRRKYDVKMRVNRLEVETERKKKLRAQEKISLRMKKIASLRKRLKKMEREEDAEEF